jgi:hypothetical protein
MKTKKDDFFTRNSDLSMEFSKYVLVRGSYLEKRITC